MEVKFPNSQDSQEIFARQSMIATLALLAIMAYVYLPFLMIKDAELKELEAVLLEHIAQQVV